MSNKIESFFINHNPKRFVIMMADSPFPTATMCTYKAST